MLRKRSTIIYMDSLVQITDIIPSAKLDLRYATTNNITGRVLYPEAKAFLVPDAAMALKKVHMDLGSRGLGIMVWDAYRPLSVTHALYNATPESQKHYVADPEEGSRHNRGTTIDQTLFNLASGQPLKMPTDFDDFSEHASPNFDEPDQERRRNRDLLIGQMEKHGFIVNEHEWWHYDWHEWADYPVLDTPIEEL
ncbi:MAG: D-alanyl-D-alanine dipeptidase [Candidatus Saccharibacteria bacterium]|nr:D-alanyl-D-alanine dipeptidase [Candidatus Saccharibacteria bacterium]